jgi:hypothetical protein
MQPTPDMSILSTVQDELRDMRRVQQYGQEEDLKDALGRMIQRVEEFVSVFETHACICVSKLWLTVNPLISCDTHVCVLECTLSESPRIAD